MPDMEKPRRSGIVLADKPRTMSSARLVAELKKSFSGSRTGHTGTLDRFASGLMILLVGRATVFAEYFLHLNKSYTASFKLGYSTDTHDSTGTVTERRSIEKTRLFMQNNRELIIKTIKSIKNQKEQVPPIYSALKKNGKRFSDLARKGVHVIPASRNIRVDSLEILEFKMESESVEIDLRVSSGTYIRAFARDLSKMLSFPMHLAELRRISVGEFSINNMALWSPGAKKAQLLDIREVLKEWPEIEVGGEIAARILNGEYVDMAHSFATNTNFFIVGSDNRLLAWARAENRHYKYERVFSD